MRSVRAESVRRSVFTAAGAIVLVGVFGPWLRSGASTRSSFELLDLVERLGFSPGGPFDWAVRGWPFVPMLIVAAIVACWAGLAAVSVRVGFVASLYVAGVSLGVRNAPDAGMVRTGWAVEVALTGAVCLLLASVWIAATPPSGLPKTSLDEDVAE
jgi:hypothetical protein